jgi:hypothetical protein
MIRPRKTTRLTAGLRRGTVSVEFALMAPVMILVCFGMVEISELMQIKKDMSIAVREGARLATMDRRDFKHAQKTTNAKIEHDIRTILTANALPGDEVTILITEVGDLNTKFDLDDPDNNERFFQILIEYHAADLLAFPLPDNGAFTIGAKIVFRNGRAATVQ